MFPWFKNTFAVLLPSISGVIFCFLVSQLLPVVRSITKNFPMVTIICLIFNVSYSKPFFLDYYQVSSQWQFCGQPVILRQTGFRILSRGSRSTNWSEIANNVKAISIDLFSGICVRYPYYHRRCEVCQTPGLPGYQ